MPETSPKEQKIICTKAALLKVLANPIRLCIVRELLVRGECNVSSLQHCLKKPQTTVSQHLGRLRDMGIVQGERQGTAVFYRLINREAAAVVKVLFSTEGTKGDEK